MKIEFLVKYAKPKESAFKAKTEEEQEEERIKRIIGNEPLEDGQKTIENSFMKMFNPDNMEFFYRPYVIDIDNIDDFYPWDEEHTVIIRKTGEELPIKFPWAEFKNAWEYVTGERIRSLELVPVATKKEKK